MPVFSKETVLEQYRKEVREGEYQAIRELWKRHSVAEDNRDLPGLVSTLTEDCRYEIVGSPHAWVGHPGAVEFYQTLLGGIPDAKFDLQRIVIGPQGVFEEAILSGTHQAPMLGYTPTQRAIRGTVAILFPWDPAKQLFSGERIYLHLPTILGL